MVRDFTTKRLHVRPWAPDLRGPEAREAATELLGPILTEEVLAPLPPSLALHGGDVAGWVLARLAESQLFLISDLEEKALGLLIVAGPFEEARDTLHIGYLLGRDHWGKGYATELLRGLVAAIDGGTRLIAGVASDNPASAAVLRKVGFVETGETADLLTFAYPG